MAASRTQRATTAATVVVAGGMSVTHPLVPLVHSGFGATLSVLPTELNDCQPLLLSRW
jgi:hypothetical protein